MTIPTKATNDPRLEARAQAEFVLRPNLRVRALRGICARGWRDGEERTGERATFLRLAPGDEVCLVVEPSTRGSGAQDAAAVTAMYLGGAIDLL